MSAKPAGDGWIDNEGEKPRRAKGKKVRVMLRGTGEEPVEAKLPWDADTTRWTVSAKNDPCRQFDVVKWRPV